MMRRVWRKLLREERTSSSTAPTRTPELSSMLERADESQLEAELHYELGVALLEKNLDEDGARYLERSFQLNPLNIVRFVRSEDTRPIRTRQAVVELMLRVRREAEQRSFRGYA